MLFNSIDFIFFFPLVILLYFLTPARFRWVLLLIASYYFYMCWKAEYAILILLSTVVDYFVAIKMEETEEKKDRKKWLYISLFVNLGILFTFKYFNFFSESVQVALNAFNIFDGGWVHQLLLPVGISFYTFQTLSYSIDVYKGDIKAERHFGFFALYVSFFPQLVAGPIERPGRLLPQLKKKHSFDPARVVDGMKLMTWGFFMKLVVADRLSPFVDSVYSNPDKFQGLQVLLATIFFAFQIFCDFAGYSLIARGTSRVMGYELMKNFKRPYLASSIREFWQRWHISLSTWFRDYLYIPLGGNRVVKWRWYYNLMVTFVVSGLWHGANWTFVAWGFLHGLYLIVEILFKPVGDRLDQNKTVAKVRNLLAIPFTFFLATFAWIFFRAGSIGDAFTLIGNMTNMQANQFSFAKMPKTSGTELLLMFLAIGILMLYHFWEELKWGPPPMRSENVIVRWVTYVLVVMAILGFGVYTSSEFIYFQF